MRMHRDVSGAYPLRRFRSVMCRVSSLTRVGFAERDKRYSPRTLGQLLRTRKSIVHGSVAVLINFGFAFGGCEVVLDVGSRADSGARENSSWHDADIDHRAPEDASSSGDGSLS